MKLVVVVAVTAIGCARRGEPDLIETIERFTKTMCACTDQTCAVEVNEEMSTWGAELMKRSPHAVDVLGVRKQMSRYTECMTTLVLQPPKAAQ